MLLYWLQGFYPNFICIGCQAQVLSYAPGREYYIAGEFIGLCVAIALYFDYHIFPFSCIIQLTLLLNQLIS